MDDGAGMSHHHGVARQLTLVAFYGPKPEPLAKLLEGCRSVLAAAGIGFRPYDPRQIHATLIGLESVPGSRRENRNLAALRGVRRPMDRSGFLAAARRGDAVSWTVQWGGFGEQATPFLSRGRSPFLRSFSFQSDRAVLIGWPVERDAAAERRYPRVLERVRRDAEAFGILHAYHAGPGDRDNDLYMRLGWIDPARSTDDRLAGVAQELRDCLATAGPLDVGLTTEQVGVAAYSDESLPWESTDWCSLADLELHDWLRRRGVE